MEVAPTFMPSVSSLKPLFKIAALVTQVLTSVISTEVICFRPIVMYNNNGSIWYVNEYEYIFISSDEINIVSACKKCVKDYQIENEVYNAKPRYPKSAIQPDCT